ncbi:hypothetical protein BZG36_00986 [Bifiguratus adelaidae]|uniref:Peptide hydrolase n=1 Tax=Bifiguratus adelaidae TaxID=1938954 RepID=A0A261Y6I3_9FUNG|nr:hypothetical protein BZG36_00986 [Bifiguratus adelaidae]
MVRLFGMPYRKWSPRVQLQGNLVWDRLAEMTDLYGPRISGSEALEKSIDWVVHMAGKVDGLEVRTQEVNVTYFKRGAESLTLLSETRGAVPLTMIGLGMATPGNVTAQVVMAHSFEEFEAMDKETIKGKIVCINPPWSDYFGFARYRLLGAKVAADKGAVGFLIRSATPFSLNTVHTGSSVPAGIPAAAITPEHADMLDRMSRRTSLNSSSPFAHLFTAPVVRLEMASELFPRVSRNVIIDLPGADPDPKVAQEIVLVSGHIDSWDVGQGAVDDGAGSFVAWDVIRVLSQLEQRPRRTVRAVLYTNEENGLAGAYAYRQALDDKALQNHIFAIESDTGVFKPWGLSFQSASTDQRTIAKQTAYLTRMGEHVKRRMPDGYHGGHVTTGFTGADIEPLCQDGVPCAGWLSLDAIKKDEFGLNGYFYYHHTHADTVSALNATDIAASI